MAYMFHDEKDEIVVNTVETDAYWHILSVDDEPSIQEITILVLDSFRFENKKLKISTASSAKEAINFLKNNDDVALVLLDIVMESSDAGFEVARFLREEQKNHSTRIVIRTGQPGSFPEETVIQDFDIDGFAEKTDLTKQRLSTIVYSTLRAYRDITAVETCKLRLSSLISSLNRLTQVKDLIQLEEQLKLELNSLVHAVQNISLHQVSKEGTIKTIFPTNWENESLEKALTHSHQEAKETSTDNTFISYHKFNDGNSLHLVFELNNSLCEVGHDTCTALANSVYLVTNALLKDVS